MAEDLEDDDEDLFEAWAILEPLPDFVYKIDHSNKGLLHSIIARYPVKDKEDSCWCVAPGTVVWAGPSSLATVGLSIGVTVDRFLLGEAYATISEVLQRFETLQVHERQSLMADNEKLRKRIQEAEMERDNNAIRLRALETLKAPDIKKPIPTFDLETL